MIGIALAFACAAGGADISAQARQQTGRQAAEGPAVTPAEIQRMFEAYALVQAQEQLKLADDRYPQFLARFKALQDVRRRGQQEHARLVQELRRLTADTAAEENQIKERVKALDDLDARTQAEIRKATDAVDSVLDVRQQGMFRVFEEQMERRKIELLTRARQANRAKNKLPE